MWVISPIIFNICPHTRPIISTGTTFIPFYRCWGSLIFQSWYLPGYLEIMMILLPSTILFISDWMCHFIWLRWNWNHRSFRRWIADMFGHRKWITLISFLFRAYLWRQSLQLMLWWRLVMRSSKCLLMLLRLNTILMVVWRFRIIIGLNYCVCRWDGISMCNGLCTILNMLFLSFLHFGADVIVISLRLRTHRWRHHISCTWVCCRVRTAHSLFVVCLLGIGFTWLVKWLLERANDFLF